MTTYQQIFENNRQWVQDNLEKDPTYFEEMAKDQTPNFLFIGCSDSRVPEAAIMGIKPGEVFTHRNIANMVVNTDLNAQSVIQYAVDVLKVKDIIVCGHYGCGGVKAAMEPKDLGLLNGWLRNIRDVYRLHKPELDAIEDEEQRYRRLVELNVQEQCVNITKTAVVQNNYLERQLPIVHGWVYDIREGLLVDLNIDFPQILSKIQEVYRLTV